MKKLILIYILIFQMISPIASAQQIHESENSSIITPINKGQKAPYTGVLFSPEAAATVTINLKLIDEKVKLAISQTNEENLAKCEAKVNESKIKLETNNKILQASLIAREKENKVLANKLEKEEKNKSNTTLLSTASFLGGVAVTILTVLALK